MIKQNIFSLDASAQYTIDDFIISNCNIEAYNAILNWKKKWGVDPYKNSILIKGDKSSGKTFLASIWSSMSGAKFINPDKKISEKMIQSHHCFIIDGLHLYSMEENILHYFNLIFEYKKLLLITSHNYNTSIKLSDLASRINSLYQINLFPPDDALMKLIIFKFFATRATTIKLEVIDYLLNILPRDMRVILNLMNKINSIALSSKKKVTVPFVKNIIKTYLYTENSCI